jgi:hypothetical protein
MARRSGGLGLGGILVITGLLYYTGYGAQMLSTMQGFNQGCYGTVGGLSRAVASPLCKGVDVVVGGITTVADYVGDVLHSIDDTIGGVRGAAPRLSMDSIGSAFSGYASPSARLQQMMQGSPQQWFSGGDVSQRFQRAVDSFSISQHYLKQGNVAQAMPWLTESARQPGGYGLLSQMSLADMYRRGSNGIAPDAGRARAYYSQAASSLGELSRDGSAEAQQLLHALPASPQEMQQQLMQAAQAVK